MSDPIKPVIAVAMTDPVDGSTPGIPIALRDMALAREIVTLGKFIRYLVEAEHPFASDTFKDRLVAARIDIAEKFLLQSGRGNQHGEKAQDPIRPGSGRE
jgi:hypothetical protein